MVEVKFIEERIREIFNRYNDRIDVENALKDLGFDLWGFTKKPDNSDNLDEQIWGYEKGIPNGLKPIIVGGKPIFLFRFVLGIILYFYQK